MSKTNWFEAHDALCVYGHLELARMSRENREGLCEAQAEYWAKLAVAADDERDAERAKLFERAKV